MPRTYRVLFPSLTVSAPQDLLQIKGAAGKILRIKRTFWSDTDTTLPTAQMVATRCRFLPATVTDGSGGGSPTIAPVDPGDAAASFTALANNTTKATTGGAAAVLDDDSQHIFNGGDRVFADPPLVGPGESFVFELLSTVTGTVNMNGGVEVEEIGG